MVILEGKYNTAKVFTDNIEGEAISQVIELLNQPFIEHSNVRIMPDTHAGKGCVIGTTMNIQDKVVPNLVGVDIGCGMFVTKLGKIDIDFPSLDKFIFNQIPHGQGNNKVAKADFNRNIDNLLCLKGLEKSSDEFNKAIGSLGGGNHFIELNIDSQNNVYLVIHSGSRNMGLRIANYYQKLAIKNHNNYSQEFLDAKNKIINQYRQENRKNEIPSAIDELKKYYDMQVKMPDHLCYLEGESTQDYLHDLGIAQLYAKVNREIMARRIVEENLKMNFLSLQSFHTVHNYIDLSIMMLRKGAISARENELLIIPINMRDGSLLAYGKGNPDWNWSAPHGAGRLMSRTEAKRTIDMQEFKDSMSNVYSTSVRESTLDESPMAYKPIEEIIENTKDTIEIADILKPIYNFKA